ncbi:hypothetical protein C8J30_11572 [Rhodobacter viridis]|uniref:Uncharacterized protein n=2 Tax=Rhodobacter viridis TaxID=1054202 RepID=A0A318U0A0_9RHOB|nr:hypothetical protein C8J30_11572 [Rhodobacter viridis]
MRLAGLLNCTDCKREHFNALRRHGNLTFFSAANASDVEAQWQAFTLSQAFELRLQLDLMGGEAGAEIAAIGIPPSFAASALSNALGRGRAEGIDLAAPGTYAGVVVFEAIDGDGSPLRFTRWFCQNIGMLEASLAILEQKEKATAVRVFLVNTARAAAFVRKRAEDLGLSEASDEI